MDSKKAQYRKSVWWQTNPISMIISYNIIKPWDMIYNQLFCWRELFYNANEFCFYIRRIEITVVAIGLIFTFINKKYRKELSFLAFLYLINIYLYATTFSFDRYAQPFLILRFIAFGFALLQLKILFTPKKTEHICNKLFDSSVRNKI